MIILKYLVKKRQKWKFGQAFDSFGYSVVNAPLPCFLCLWF